MRSKLSGVTSSMSPRRATDTPALLTRQSTPPAERPCCVDAAACPRGPRFRGDEATPPPPPARPRRRVSPRSSASPQVDDDEVEAGAREANATRAADAAAAAGDERHLSRAAVLPYFALGRRLPPLSSRHQLPAVDLDDLAVDVARTLVRRSRKRAGAVDGCAKRSIGTVLRSALQHLLRRDPLAERRLDHPRRQRVDADASGPSSLAQFLLSRRDERLRPRVERRASAAAAAPGDRRRIDDRAAGLLPGPRQRGLCSPSPAAGR